MRRVQNNRLVKAGDRRTLSIARALVAVFFGLTFHSTLNTQHSEAEAAISKGKNQQLETAGTSQGGGTASSSKFRQQLSVGEAVAGQRISSSRFRVLPGFLGASLSAPSAAPVSELDMHVLYAKTDFLGLTIAPAAWQNDRDPVFLWEPPAPGLDIAGYSYAMDSSPDDQIDTALTSFDVAEGALKTLADGKHTFAVKAINSAGNAGKPVTVELWVDTTPPQISAYSPSPGSLLNTLTPQVSATVSDQGSGVDQTGITLSINGGDAAVTFEASTGQVTATRGGWKEGSNSVTLRVGDVAGNTMESPLVWGVMIDTIPPTGSLRINGGAAMTTSLHVSLGLSASDATSGVARMLLSNEELTGYVEEPYVSLRELWRLNAIRGQQTVYVKFVDRAGNTSEPVSDQIDLWLLSPETVITSGPAGSTPARDASFAFTCPEGGCVFSYAFDNDEWSAWSPATSAQNAAMTFGNHYFRVKAAKEANGTPGIQADEEDPSPAERTWVVGVEAPIFAVPKGPSIKFWRLD